MSRVYHLKVEIVDFGLTLTKADFTTDYSDPESSMKLQVILSLIIQI